MQIMAGRYRLDEPVGRGGFAVVYRAYDRTLNRQVAIKLLDSAQPRETLGEAQAAAKLNHPNVARVYDYGETTANGRTTPFMVMEYVDGDTLADRLDRDGALPWAEAAAVCTQVASALTAAHAQGLVHRDIKPRNVMLAPTGVKVVDFGVAAMAGQRSADNEGRIWGTPLYLAPEQLRGERCFPPADVFALGLLLHACLTGKPPWSGAGADEVFAARRLRPVPALPGTCDVPPGLVALHDKCVQPLARRRPEAAEIAAVLRRYAGGGRVPRPAATAATGVLRETPAPRSRAVLVGTATVAALIAGALVLPWSPGGTTEAAAQGALTPSSRPRPALSASSAAADVVTTTQAPERTAPVPGRPRTSPPANNREAPPATKPVATVTPTPTLRPSTAPSSAPTSTPSSPTPSAAPPTTSHGPSPTATTLAPDIPTHSTSADVGGSTGPTRSSAPASPEQSGREVTA